VPNHSTLVIMVDLFPYSKYVVINF